LRQSGRTVSRERVVAPGFVLVGGETGLAAERQRRRPPCVCIGVRKKTSRIQEGWIGVIF
jgi:hypothetical protein